MDSGKADLSSGASDRWIVGVSGPRNGAIGECLEDAIVEESIQSADLPSTHLSIKLRAEAKKEDADLIADCLRDRLKSGDVSVVGPRD
jgi:hypothetical protein